MRDANVKNAPLAQDWGGPGEALGRPWGGQLNPQQFHSNVSGFSSDRDRNLAAVWSVANGYVTTHLKNQLSVGSIAATLRDS